MEIHVQLIIRVCYTKIRVEGTILKNNNQKYTNVGTDIELIKEQARKSGLSYNEAKEWIAKKTGGRGTHIYSDTNVEEVKRQNELSSNNK